MRQPTFWRSVSHAWSGLVYTFRTQRNARWHVIGGLAAVALATWLQLDLIRWAILALTIGAVGAGETINTTVEALVDLMSPEWHERAKVAKDVSAGAVLLLAMTAVVVGLLKLGLEGVHWCRAWLGRARNAIGEELRTDQSAAPAGLVHRIESRNAFVACVGNHDRGELVASHARQHIPAAQGAAQRAGAPVDGD